MKYEPNIYDPTNCPPDPRRSYLGTDGRLLVGYPIMLMMLVLIAWAGFESLPKGTSKITASADTASVSQVARAPDSATAAVVPRVR